VHIASSKESIPKRSRNKKSINPQIIQIPLTATSSMINLIESKADKTEQDDE